MQLTCGECNGTGKLTRLGGDWGKQPDTTVTCWACKGTGTAKPVTSSKLSMTKTTIAKLIDKARKQGGEIVWEGTNKPAPTTEVVVLTNGEIYVEDANGMLLVGRCL